MMKDKVLLSALEHSKKRAITGTGGTLRFLCMYLKDISAIENIIYTVWYLNIANNLNLTKFCSQHLVSVLQQQT